MRTGCIGPPPPELVAVAPEPATLQERAATSAVWYDPQGRSAPRE